MESERLNELKKIRELLESIKSILKNGFKELNTRLEDVQDKFPGFK
ncbi:MAG: hypothetical protein ACFE8E_08300 [Candidatus Hodarchaeota archaeon]